MQRQNGRRCSERKVLVWVPCIDKKLIFDVTYEEIGVVRFHFSFHCDTVHLFVKLTKNEKQLNVKTNSAIQRSL